MALRIALAALAMAGCAGSGELPTELVGTVAMPDGTPHSGAMVVMEKGRLNTTFDLRHGVLTDEDGHYEIAVPDGREWGLHVYVSPRYLYVPQEVYLLPHSRTTAGQAKINWEVWMQSGIDVDVEWPSQPDDPGMVTPQPDGNRVDNPEVWGARCESSGGRSVLLSVEADDRDNDMTQVVAFNATTGFATMMSPANGWENKRFRNGTFSYDHRVTDAEADREVTWMFTAADFRCNNSQVIRLVVPPGYDCDHAAF